MNELIRRILATRPQYLQLTGDEIAQLRAYMTERRRPRVSFRQLSEDPAYSAQSDDRNAETKFLRAVLVYNEDPLRANRSPTEPSSHHIDEVRSPNNAPALTIDTARDDIEGRRGTGGASISPVDSVKPRVPSEETLKWARQTELVKAVNKVLGEGELDPGVLSNACTAGKISTNQEPGRKCRVEVRSFLAWIAQKRTLSKDEIDQVRNAIIGEIMTRK